ncbi:MAG: hypothetical protein ACKPKO_09850, partial [Candidatus Fonsibacter sp.]
MDDLDVEVSGQLVKTTHWLQLIIVRGWACILVTDILQCDHIAPIWSRFICTLACHTLLYIFKLTNP